MKGYGGFVKAVIASEVRNGFFNDDFFGTPKQNGADRGNRGL